MECNNKACIKAKLEKQYEYVMQLNNSNLLFYCYNDSNDESIVTNGMHTIIENVKEMKSFENVAVIQSRCGKCMILDTTIPMKLFEMACEEVALQRRIGETKYIVVKLTINNVENKTIIIDTLDASIKYQFDNVIKIDMDSFAVRITKEDGSTIKLNGKNGDIINL